MEEEIVINPAHGSLLKMNKLSQKIFSKLLFTDPFSEFFFI
jgi:hypothetical protein